MIAEDSRLLLWCLAGAVAVLSVLLLLCLRALLRQGAQLARHKELTDAEGNRRVEKSRSVLLGQVAEHFAPLLPGFDYNPKDARFLGAPVDYLVFDGMSDAKATDGMEIVFCEIKSGGSQLTNGEKAIRDAIKAGRVRFEILRLCPDGSLRRE
jgi:predicted Holliday junction resolvase-like endonuclease